MNLFHRLFYSCEDATRISVIAKESKPNLVTRFRLWMHRQACAFCKLFDEQIQIIDKNVHSLKDESKATHVDESTKQKWKTTLRNTHSGTLN